MARLCCSPDAAAPGLGRARAAARGDVCQREIAASAFQTFFLTSTPVSVLAQPHCFKVKSLCQGAFLEAPVPPCATLSRDREIPIPMCSVFPSCLLSVPLPTGQRCHCPVPLCPHCSSTSRGGDGALGVVGTPLGSSSWWLSGLGVRWDNRGTEGQAQAEAPLQGPSCTLRHRHRGHRPSAAMFSSCQGSRGHRQPEPQGPAPRGQGSLEQERRWKQYLEDERIALFLQNEEFMKELQRNRDFLLALERGEKRLQKHLSPRFGCVPPQ